MRYCSVSRERDDSPDAWMPIDVVTGAVARQIPSVLFQQAPDLFRFGLHYHVSFVIYMPIFSEDVNLFRANI